MEPYTKGDSFNSILFEMDTQIDYMIKKLNIKNIKKINIGRFFKMIMDT
jgi:hypothetical protein